MATVFFSYSHRDKGMRDELEIHLSILKRQGIIDTWHDRRILPGDKFGHTIDANLRESNIILLLVSPYFLDSDYCYEREMDTAIAMHDEGKARIIPVILEHCDWKNTPLKEFLAIPRDGKPISEYPNVNKAFHEVTEEIRSVAEKFSALTVGREYPATASSTEPIQPQENLRSSNLRIKKTFFDYDKDKFVSDAFEYMAKFFENSLKELTARNSEAEYDYRRIDANSFVATLYSNGEERSACKIILRGKDYHMGRITYSHGNMNDNSTNASLDVKDDGHILYLSPQLGFMSFESKPEKLSLLGAAECYWRHFIEPLQR